MSKYYYLNFFLILSFIPSLLFSCSRKVVDIEKKDPASDDPIALGYTLQSSMQGSSSLTGKDYTQIHKLLGITVRLGD